MAYSIIKTSDGGHAIGGFTNSFGIGSFDAWLVKLEAEKTPITWEYVFKDSSRQTDLRISTDDKHFQFVAPDREFPIKHDPNMLVYERRFFTSITIRYEDEEIKMSVYATNDRFDFCFSYARDKLTGQRYILVDGWRQQGTC